MAETGAVAAATSAASAAAATTTTGGLSGRNTIANGAAETSTEGLPAYGGVYVRGVLYPSFMKEEQVALLNEQNESESSDIFLVTYPKTGTTMTQHMLSLILNDGEQPERHMMDEVPWIEKEFCVGGLNMDKLAALPRPRAFKTHASYHMFPAKNMSTPRLIIITRNPKDTAVSLFHHMRNKKSFDFEGTWDDFFAMMKQETVESSNFFKWHAPYWKAYREGRINALWLHYEWVTEHLEEAVAKVAAFVDKDLPSETVKKIASACTLDSMKANPKADCSWISGKQGDAKHLRKGGKGGWMDVFTNEQNQEMNGWIQTWATLMPDLDWDYGV